MFLCISIRPRHLGGLHELTLYEAVVVRVGGIRAPRVVHGDVGDGLLADHVGNLLVGVCRLAPEEQQRVAGVHYGLGIVLPVGLLKLGEGLQDHRDRDVAASRDGDHALEVRYGTDVCELVEHEVDASGQPSREARERRLAERV